MSRFTQALGTAAAVVVLPIVQATGSLSATAVQVPANLENQQSEQRGAQLFRQNCVQCHGAPGIAEPVRGLVPPPPDLLRAGRRNDPAEIFPKIKNGIPATAMPAWGDQLSDQDIWALAAFLHHSRGISASDFDTLSKSGQVTQ